MMKKLIFLSIPLLLWYSFSSREERGQTDSRGPDTAATETAEKFRETNPPTEPEKSRELTRRFAEALERETQLRTAFSQANPLELEPTSPEAVEWSDSRLTELLENARQSEHGYSAAAAQEILAECERARWTPEQKSRFLGNLREELQKLPRQPSPDSHEWVQLYLALEQDPHAAESVIAEFAPRISP